jgi:hypothetical protein
MLPRLDITCRQYYILYSESITGEPIESLKVRQVPFFNVLQKGSLAAADIGEILRKQSYRIESEFVEKT